MHCRACDDLLSDRETNRKTASGEYPDLCDRCFGTIADIVEVTENPLFESDSPLGEPTHVDSSEDIGTEIQS